MSSRIACVLFPYFLACSERSRNPVLRDRPLVVCRAGKVAGVSPEVGEALAGLPTARARVLCPEASFREYDDGYYREVHRRCLEVISGFSPVIEPLGYEECLFDLTGAAIPDLERFRLALRGLGLGPVAAGVGGNRLVARLAARLAFMRRAQGKRSGFFLVQVKPGSEERFVERLPLDFDGFLPSAAVRCLQDLGFRYPEEIKGLSPAALSGLLGSDGYVVYQHIRGKDHTPLTGLYPPDKVACCFSFAGGISDRLGFGQACRDGAARIAEVLVKRRQGCRQVALRLEMEEGSCEASRILNQGSCEAKTLREVTLILLKGMAVSSPVHALRLEASSLYDLEFLEQDLFAMNSRRGSSTAGVRELLEQKFPGVLKKPEIDRREEVLSWWDPWRFAGDTP